MPVEIKELHITVAPPPAPATADPHAELPPPALRPIDVGEILERRARSVRRLQAH